MSSETGTASVRILYIDDDPDRSAALFRQHFSRIEVLNTNDSDFLQKLENEATRADIIVTDYDLKDTLRSAGAALYPRDGQALNEVIDSMMRRLTRKAVFTIYSAQLSRIPGLEKLDGVPHLQARKLGVVLVGTKHRPEEFMRRLAVVADGLKQVKGWVPNRGTTLRELFVPALRIPDDAAWREDAIIEVERFRPPVQEMEEREDKAAFLSWLALEIFPYPTFLIGLEHVALALRVDPDWLDKAISKRGDEILRELEGVRYKGILADLEGPRWWRVGLNQELWKATRQRPWDRETLGGIVKTWFGEDVRLIEQPDPVLLYDEFGRTTKDVADVSETVRFMPSGWPAPAPWPSARIDEIKNDDVWRQLVVPEDERRLA